MTNNIIIALILSLCPDPELIKPEYVIQGEQVNCMEYYTNDIINNPDTYKKYMKSTLVKDLDSLSASARRNFD